MKIETLEKLKIFANPNNQEYKDLLRKLILQGAVKLLEETVILRVRKIDKTFIERILKEIETEYYDYLKRETGEDFSVKFEFDSVHLENE